MDKEFELNNSTEELAQTENRTEEPSASKDEVFIEFEDEDVSWADEDDSEHEEISSPAEFTVVHTERKKPKRKAVKFIALSLACGLVFGAGFGLASGLTKKHAVSKIPVGTTDVALHKGESGVYTSDIADIAQACMPSVVAITNHSVEDVMTFFGPYSQEVVSSGSGIIIGKNDSELLIVTNYHVVTNTKGLKVVFSCVEERLETGVDVNEIDDGTIPPAVVKGYDAEKDLAVIAVRLEEIPADILAEVKIAALGDSSKLRPGDRVVAIGNSLGYGQSVTTGIVSAVDREITMQSANGKGTVTNAYIQTDAAINQGNSGGALLDMYGNLIGINSVKIATTGVEGMGYAIPISDVEGIIDDLMIQKTRYEVEEDKQGFLGISGSDISEEATQMYGMPSGVYVNSVEKGLAADKAGIKEGYIITAFEGDKISSITQLQEKLRYYEEGEKVKVTVKIPSENGYIDKELEVVLSNRSKNIKE